MKKRPNSSSRAPGSTPRSPTRYELHLFIAGASPRSAAALANVTALCEDRLKGRFDLVVVDVYEEPQRAKEEQIIAVPTLLRASPLPRRKLVGDLSDRAAVLAALDLPAEDRTP